MSSTIAITNSPVEELYELCLRNGFIDARPVAARGLSRSESSPALMVSPREMTLMLRNIPCSVNDERMEFVLKQHGFAGLYDYLYVPMRRNGSNLGFGFVNFTYEEDAIRFKAVFSGYRFSGTNSTKQCSITPAEIQGREANIRMNAQYRRRNDSSPGQNNP
eukprot:TRINITY_DN6994_c0_g1_i1.p1 TRINITY_DN6994_c0_g1~~TRINITY_DN6994_c0_g1_i1.p1  ORF type:complete len:162 (+),score=16.09 TRINITY_DN6994_c0_g1_i1:54-539(+)